MADLPALGYRTYRLLLVASSGDSATSAIPDTESDQQVAPVLENEQLRLTFDRHTGAIAQLYDKAAHVNVFDGLAALPVVIDDPSDTWSHGVYAFQHVIAPMTLKSIRQTEAGTVQATVRVVSTFGTSSLTQDFTLYRDSRMITVRVTVDWHEHFKMLKLRFPLKLHFMKATREIPYGAIECFTNGEELPIQSWVDLSGSARDTDELYGVSILNDGKSSGDIFNRDIGLTVLRSPIYAHHEPFIPDADHEYSFIDQGIQHFTYAILPHTGSWEQAETVRRALELNQPPIALFGTFHAGSLPLISLAENILAEPDNLVISVVKHAEDNDDLIVRCYESAHRTTSGTLHVFDQHITAIFSPCEIKTFRIPKDGSICETNLLESDQV